jgi:hypothetical protein
MDSRIIKPALSVILKMKINSQWEAREKKASFPLTFNWSNNSKVRFPHLSDVTAEVGHGELLLTVRAGFLYLH